MQVTNFTKNKASKIFWAWVFIQSIFWIISVCDGSALEDMLKAVDYAEKSDPSAMNHNTEAWGFELISLAFFVICTLLGAFLIHFTEKGRRWAVFLLIPFALWSFYYSASYPFEISEMYSEKIDFWGIFNALLGGAVWIAILFFAYRQYQVLNMTRK